MNNKELYQKTFSRLHASENLEMEDIIMKKKKFRLPKMAACFMAAFILTSIVGVGAYAAVSGDFFGTIKVIFDGKERDVDFYQREDGSLYGKIPRESEKGDLKVWVENAQKDLDSIPALDDIDIDSDVDGVCITFIETPPIATEEDGHIFISYHDEDLDITEEIEKNNYYEYKYQDKENQKIMKVFRNENGDIDAEYYDAEE